MSANKEGPGTPKKHRLLRARAVPTDAASREELVRALTRTITRIEAHVRTGSNWRNRRQLDALRRAVDERGKVLDLLRADAPTAWETLAADLHLERPTVEED